MIEGPFIDTNVLVYAYDRSEPEKQHQARQILTWLVQHRRGVISTQILAEFFVTVTRKIVAPLSSEDAYLRLQNYLQSWYILDMTGFVVLEAARGVRDYQLNFWDAQIWALARLHQLPIVLSADFSSNRVLEGVRFINPFEDGFEIESLL